MIELIQGNCFEILSGLKANHPIIVTDPPFNIGYHYKTYKDNLPEMEYLKNIGGGNKRYSIGNNSLP